jgi:hypothetical protein
MDKFKIIIFLTGLFQLMNCQKMEKESIVPSYNVQISHTDNKHLITPVEDSLITLEGVAAHLPYGSSSGSWGNSGKGFTEQSGTPIGADIKYYAESEGVFYHLKANFPSDKVKEFSQRAYAVDESESSNEPMKKFINIHNEPDYRKKYNAFSKSYYDMSDLIFGFAPKGMVIVWLGFGATQIELGQYQAEKITNESEIKRLKEKYQKTYRVDATLFEQLAKEYYLPDESPEKWIKYRTRYNWLPQISSENKNFKLFSINTEYYNGEREIMLRPWVQNPPIENRAVPKEIAFFWETGKGEAFEGRAFFNWEKINEEFKQAKTNFKLELKIAPDNNSFEVLLGGRPIKIDSTRVYKSNFTFKDSYK